MTRTVVASIVVLVFATAVFCFVPDMDLPGRLADVIRYALVAQSFLGIGLTSFVVHHAGQFRIDDREFAPLRWVALAYYCAMLFVTLEIISRIGPGPLTWRTPLAFVVFIVGDIGLVRLVFQMRRIGFDR